MNWNKLLSIQIQTLPPTVHHKWWETAHSVCKATNEKLQEPKFWKSPNELKNNSIGLNNLWNKQLENILYSHPQPPPGLPN